MADDDTIEDRISSTAYTTGGNFIAHADLIDRASKEIPPGAQSFTICLLTLKDGTMIVGGFAPAAGETYDEALGRKLAYEKFIAQLPHAD